MTMMTSFSKDWAGASLQKAVNRIDLLLPRFTREFPSASGVNGIYQPVEKVDWTEGFWTGMLWLAYEFTSDEKYRQAAEGFLPVFQERLEKQIKTNTHDLGFLYSLSCVSAYKLTGNQQARETALLAAEMLAGRYDKTAKIIQAWGDLDDISRRGRMIIDCNLNLPLLYWAALETGNKEYYEIACNHLKQAMKYLVRPDSSTYHTYYMDIESGEGLRGTTHQGYSDESCWARGQTWAMYGFCLNYNYWQNEQLLEMSCKTSDYYLNHLPADKVAYWDLIFTEESEQWRDTSASAIGVCGLLELISWLPVSDNRRHYYEHEAVKIMNGLAGGFLAQEKDGLLLHGVYNYGRNMGIDEPNLWGDYFYMEALMRIYKPWIRYW